MNLDFRTELTRLLGDSLIEIEKLTRGVPGQAGPKSTIKQQKLNAYLERRECIEKLLEIEGVLDTLGREK